MKDITHNIIFLQVYFPLKGADTCYLQFVEVEIREADVLMPRQYQGLPSECVESRSDCPPQAQVNIFNPSSSLFQPHISPTCTLTTSSHAAVNLQHAEHNCKW